MIEFRDFGLFHAGHMPPKSFHEDGERQQSGTDRGAMPTLAGGTILHNLGVVPTKAVPAVHSVSLAAHSPSGQEMSLDLYDRRYGARRDAADGYVTILQQFLLSHLKTLPEVGGANLVGGEPVGWRDPLRVYLPQATWSQMFPGVDGQRAATALRDVQIRPPGEKGQHMRKAPRAILGRPRFYTVIIDRVTAYKVA